jgi:hypothetical protein
LGLDAIVAAITRHVDSEFVLVRCCDALVALIDDDVVDVATALACRAPPGSARDVTDEPAPSALDVHRVRVAAHRRQHNISAVRVGGTNERSRAHCWRRGRRTVGDASASRLCGRATAWGQGYRSVDEQRRRHSDDRRTGTGDDHDVGDAQLADSASLQEWGCGALLNLICGIADGTVVLLAAGPAGIDVVLAAMWRHLNSALLPSRGCGVL